MIGLGVFCTCQWFAASNELNDPRRRIRDIRFWIVLLLLTITPTANAITVDTSNWLKLAHRKYANLSSIEPLCSILQRDRVLVGPLATLCNKKPIMIAQIQTGLYHAVKECVHQFAWERWNCTLDEEDPHIFGSNLLKQGTKENAFVQAVLTAGVSYAIANSCQQGAIEDCTCNSNPPKEKYRHEVNISMNQWRWEGCNPSMRYGHWFTKNFLDDKMPKDASPKMKNIVQVNQHNSNVGRKAVDKQLELKCRCQGTSGTCQVKVCWLQLTSFMRVGDYLKHLYVNRASRLTSRRKRFESPTSDELIFVQDSPDYCRRKTKKGILGTRGRQCSHTASPGDPASCELLCCGRGYNVEVRQVRSRCSCKFVWCCRVDCKTCYTTEEVYTCK